MAEFTEVMKQRKRMCNSMTGCSSCGLQYGCGNEIYNHLQEAEEIIMKWAEEHPAKTNADVLREVFGIELHLQDCVGVECPKDVNGKRESCSDCDFKDFWEREYVEPSKDN